MRRSGVWAAAAVLSIACSDSTTSQKRAETDGGSQGPGSGGAPGASDSGPNGNGGSGGGAAGNGAGGSGGGVGAGGGDLGAGGMVGVGGTYVWKGATPPPLASSKLDLLFVVDNSYAMGDKQDLLASMGRDFVRALTDPAAGLQDLHVGVITTSLGTPGSSACDSTATGPRGEESDDHAHLVGTRPRAASLGLTSGFASWTAGGSMADLLTGVDGLIHAAGEQGCGLEATLESLYRFAADPNPPASITIGPCPSLASAQCATPTGTDSELLAERSLFFRPDSAVAVVLLTDENDCSLRDTQQFYYAGRDDIRLPLGSAACAANPNDKCCYNCASSVPAGCTADPACKTAPTSAEDPLNLRCIDERRRYGLDFLYPVQRYVNALSKTTLCTARVDLEPIACPDLDGIGGPDVVDNPLFLGGTRTPDQVHLLGIVGVPWQTIKKQAGTDTLDYQTGAELAAGATWTAVYGDPTASPPTMPTDTLMIESIEPRTGMTTGTGEALAPPSAGYLANTVNGHEYANSQANDLQYACIFPLAPPRDCAASSGGTRSCECASVPAGDNVPICQAGDGSYGTVQRFGKAYPGLRHLGVIKGLGASAAVASICAKNVSDPTRADYGYRPAMSLLVRQLAK